MRPTLEQAVNEADQEMQFILDPAAEVGTVTLKVADLARSLAFYTQTIGLHIFEQDGQCATLGVGRRRIMALEAVAGARRPPSHTTGLYHAAILLPTRRALALRVAQWLKAGVRFGYGDHLVSEAFYLSDPDGNGLEVYQDRPRAQWVMAGGQVSMATDPVDMDSLLAEIGPGEPALADPALPDTLPDGTKLGHMHLRVADLAAAEAFYRGVLGFEVMMRVPGALFVSAGGYHHHLGLNTWESQGGEPPLEPSAGLRAFSIVLPHRAALDALTKRIAAAGIPVEYVGDSAYVLDPFHNQIALVLVGELMHG